MNKVAFGFIQEEIGWPSAHIVGHSMGGMISMKMAALKPRYGAAGLGMFLAMLCKDGLL